MFGDSDTPIGSVRFRDACSTKGGPNKLPMSPAQGYEELKDGRVATFKVGNRRYISFAAIDAYIRAREAEERAAEVLRQALEREAEATKTKLQEQCADGAHSLPVKSCTPSPTRCAEKPG